MRVLPDWSWHPLEKNAADLHPSRKGNGGPNLTLPCPSSLSSSWQCLHWLNTTGRWHHGRGSMSCIKGSHWRTKWGDKGEEQILWGEQRTPRILVPYIITFSFRNNLEGLSFQVTSFLHKYTNKIFIRCVHTIYRQSLTYSGLTYFFNLMMVQKSYTFSKNLISDFEFRPFPRLTISGIILSHFRAIPRWTTVILTIILYSYNHSVFHFQPSIQYITRGIQYLTVKIVGFALDDFTKLWANVSCSEHM